MGKFYKQFIEAEMKTRKEVIEDRKRIMSWELDPRLPSFFIEKTLELKLMVLLAMDNFTYKCLSVYIEEILMHVIVSSEINSPDEYIPRLQECEKKYRSGHKILSELNKRELIHEDDYLYCRRFLNDSKDGGERIRNIEVHNLYAEKISTFELRPEIAEKIDDDFGRNFLIQQIQTKPSFVHIGARDMVSRNIVNDIAGLNDLLNRNVDLLSKLS
ncbi:hypothetical protein [Peribacillus acanthi]|uniref:hypothetical protein n=1 Tax=Peribacillus acanthi TaxID=2171554 RepID=UPI000D3E78D5|nr:hypothetical protein [Peribacillus acanthi]